MKRIIYLGLMLVAIFTLTNCNKTEINAPEETKGIPFTITLEADTKTAVEGEAVKWVAGDQINVFHAAAGTTIYGTNDQFTIAEADLANGLFKGTLTEPLNASNDWYFLYPYSSYITTPANTSTGYTYIGKRSDQAQEQIANDSKAHLAGKDFPLTCRVLNVAEGTIPTGKMKQIASVVEVKVTNSLTDPLSVKSVSFTGTENIVGTFYIDFTSDAPSFTDGPYVAPTANLTINGGAGGAEITTGNSASFYIGIKPFTAPKDAILKVSVNGHEKEHKLANPATFVAGKTHTLNFNYNIVPTPKATFVFDQGRGSADEYTYESSPITLVVSKGTHTNTSPNEHADGHLRFYGSSSGYNTATFTTSGSNNITKIIFYCTGTTYTKKLVPTSGVVANPEGTKVTWTGNTSGVQFTTPEQSRFLSVDVYYSAGSTKSIQTLTFPNATETATIGGDPFISPTVSGANTTVTYSSSNTGVATVNPTSGEVTLVSAGTTTITATAEETDQYYSATASYTLNVVKKAQNLYFDDPTVTKDVSDAPFTITVNGAQPDATVTYSSSNEAVAKVDNNGLVTLQGATGTANITANATETATHASGSASYTLNVTDSSSPSVSYEPEVTWTLGPDAAYDNTSTGNNKQYATAVNGIAVANLLKLGKSAAGGYATVTIPAGATSLEFYCLGWKAKNVDVTVTQYDASNVQVGTAETFTAKNNDGATGNAPYTITMTDAEYLHSIAIQSGVTSIKLETSKNASSGDNRALFLKMRTL